MKGRYRAACALADAARLQRRWPAYQIHGVPGAWTAVHLQSGGVLETVKTPRKLGRVIEADSLARPVLLANGRTVTIRAESGTPRRPSWLHIRSAPPRPLTDYPSAWAARMLWMVWGGGYRIGCIGGQWTAIWPDGRRLTAPTSEGIHQALLAAWARWGAR